MTPENIKQLANEVGVLLDKLYDESPIMFYGLIETVKRKADVHFDLKLIKFMTKSEEVK
jgi:1-aminocyclopropane-1-carboxylate deaminase/D-cysteine desulfhydrase-like pyridoxal-dependent ACC family enzyme